MKHTARCLLLGAALLASLPAFAQYSWIDNEGRRVFSDQPPPPDIPRSSILVASPTPIASEPAAAPPAPALAASGQDQMLEAKKRAADAAAATQRKSETEKLAAQRANSCKRAKVALSSLQSGARIAQLDAQGQRSYMTDEQRAAEIQRMHNIVQTNCH